MRSRSSIRAALPEELFALLHIRPMVEDDLPQVIAIDRRSFALPWPESSYRFEMLENLSSFLKVADVMLPDESRLIVGVVVVWMILDEAHIATLAVDPNYRGQRIATRLMVSVMREIIRQQARLATLEVREHNTTAQRLYQKFGYKIVGRRSRYYKDNQEDALIMTIDGLGQNYLDWLDQGDWVKNSAEVGGL